MSAVQLPDARERHRIEHDLGTNFLVEAGAGAGKTTAMVGRMVELVRTGVAEISAIAAVTFTRKAAAELRERFQEKLEARLAEGRSAGDSESAQRLDRALRDLDQGFVGTIHSFCARILREHPVEAQIDPGFSEVSGAQEARLRRAAWLRFVEAEALSGSAALAQLESVGLSPSQVYGCYDRMVNDPDVEFPADDVPRPDVTGVRTALERLLDRAETMMPAEEPEKGWDTLQGRTIAMRFYRRVLGWHSDLVFLDALDELLAAKPKVTLNRWPVPKESVKALCVEFETFTADDSAAATLLRRWRAHRYPVILEFARRGAAWYRTSRIAAGQLTFQDLLLQTAWLLRSNPEARRRLAARYTHLLVDEFQDTDPVQAEIVYLLAAADASEPDWRAAEPRPGALFVVGDPKQSIYRFRRADISIYNQVKARFEMVGDVLPLIANFRSVPAVGRLVDAVFQGEYPLFDAASTAHQAAFAPLHTQRDESGGLGWYSIDAGEETNQDAIAACDAKAVAAWVGQDIASGRRSPGDFMLLAQQKRKLHLYARELERLGVPIQVTGAGIGVEEELRELIVLLEALCDPGDPVRTTAALLGLFFGLSYDDLVEFRLRGGVLDFLAPQVDGSGDVARALAQMRGWWECTRNGPAEVAVGAIVQELGALPYAAAGELGSSRAGALLYVIDTIRIAGLEGDTTLHAAVDALRSALDEAEAEAPLEPGGTDAVRIMNLHKAKGLEAPVVILIWPTGNSDHEPENHVHRHEDGSAAEYMSIREKKGRQERTLAEPLDWMQFSEAERRFAAAEDVRLLYVAATRARDELIVARCDAVLEKSPWAIFYEALEELGAPVELPAAPAPDRAAPTQTPERIAALVAAATAARTARGAPTFARFAVTARAKPDDSVFRTDSAPAGARGREWGTAVHAALEAALSGADGDALARACRNALLAAERPVTAEGEPAELTELIALATSMRGSEYWTRAVAAQRKLLEVPFAAFSRSSPVIRLDDPAATQGAGTAAPLTEVAIGRIDLAFREADGWVIVDYKTDAVTGADLDARIALYRRQLDLYAGAWRAITNEPIKECALVFVRGAITDSIHSWQPELMA